MINCKRVGFRTFKKCGNAPKQRESNMFSQAVPFDKKDAVVILNPGEIERLRKKNEILEHVLLQASEAKTVSGYSRMHHRHSKTSNL